jgi:hypothetical protein
VRVPAANDHRISLAGQVQIVAVATLTAQQNRVFVARNGLTDSEFGEGQLIDVDIAIHT